MARDTRIPKRMIDDVHGLNVHMIISIWVSFGLQTKQYHELKQKNMLLNFITWQQSGKIIRQVCKAGSARLNSTGMIKRES